MENNKEIIHESEVKELIIELRGEKVLIDRDVAKLYGVETRDINKAVKNNADKFPENYCFSLQLSEKQELVENFRRLESLKYSTVVPKAFTARGLFKYKIQTLCVYRTGIVYVGYYIKRSESYRNYFCHYRIIL